jgi:hypothetical protein
MLRNSGTLKQELHHPSHKSQRLSKPSLKNKYPAATASGGVMVRVISALRVDSRKPSITAVVMVIIWKSQ